MSMRWILTWKDAPLTSIAKARLVINGFQDPDLCTERAEAPTLSKLGRHSLLQMAASNGFTLEMRDVKTAFLHGDRGESERDVYAQPVPELARHLGLIVAQIIRLEGAVYGLRNAQRKWRHRVKRDMQRLGWRCHQLEQCIFLKVDAEGCLIGIRGIYVDEFLSAGNWSNPQYCAELKKVKSLCTFGGWDHHRFTLAAWIICMINGGALKRLRGNIRTA